MRGTLKLLSVGALVAGALGAGGARPRAPRPHRRLSATARPPAGWWRARRPIRRSCRPRCARRAMTSSSTMPASTAARFSTRCLHFDEAIAPGTDIALVEFGTNDLRGGASMKTVRARLAEVIRALRDRKIEVLVIGFGSLKLDDVARAENVGLCAMEPAARQIPRARPRALQRARLRHRGRAHAAAGRGADRARCRERSCTATLARCRSQVGRHQRQGRPSARRRRRHSRWLCR